MRVIFFGTAEFAVPSLERLGRSPHPVVSCVAQPDRPKGRGLVREPSPVKRAAARLGLPVAQPERLHAKLFDTVNPDIGVVAAYGQVIPRELLALPAHGMLGVHPSLLPKYRGAAPVAWAILRGETATGVTIFRLNERVDAGDIVSQRSVAIDPEEHAESLTRRLATLGAEELLLALDAIAQGRARLISQDESQASDAPKLTKAQAQIDWRASAEQIARLVRAISPWPGAMTLWRGQPLKIWAASLGDAPAAVQATPGTVIRLGREGLIVATGQGTLEINAVQPAGRRRMSVEAFLAGHRIIVGEQFGGGRGQETGGKGTG